MKKLISFVLPLAFFCMIFAESAGSAEAVGKKSLLIRGADISFYEQQKSLGIEFKKNGKECSLPEILKESGTNIIRLRLWVNPENQWNGIESTLIAAKEAKENGFGLLLDLHYSDSWADPGQQNKPGSWKSLDFMKLKERVYIWTKEVLERFVENGTIPQYIQVGNEINNGFLWPDGKIEDERGFNKFSQLMDKGCQAVRETCPDSKIVLHVANAGNYDFLKWWFGNIKRNQIDYDVIGLSYYPVWHGKNLSVISQNISRLNETFKKPVFIAETSYPWTLEWNDNTHNLVGKKEDLIPDFPATTEGQKNYLKSLCKMLSETKGAIGVCWWEPSAVSLEAMESSMENQTWFDFDYNYNGTGDVYKDFAD